MTSHNIIEWIQHPERLNKETLYELRNQVARFPYFQSLRLLLLKNLYLLHDSSFGEELRRAVLYVADRRKLFYLIEGDKYELQPHKDTAEALQAAVPASGSDRTLMLIDAFLATQPVEAASDADFDYAMDYTAYLMAEAAEADAASGDDKPAAEAEVPPLRGQNLIDDFLRRDEQNTGISFANECLDYEVPYDPERELAECPAPESVADESVAAPPETAELAADDEDEADDTAHGTDSTPQSVVNAEDSYFTETLAKIYVKQHRYDKALEIIKKLSLNYPKKNAYFADQIRFLEKLIINAKSK